MDIKVIAVEVTTVPTAKGSYQQAEVTFKNLSFQGKTETKKLMSFGAGKSSFEVLSNSKNGDEFSVDVVKNDKGYNDWVKVTSGLSGNGASTSSGGSAAPAVTRVGGSVGNAVVKNTYETPEERAKKQIYIVRQSSISAAIATLAPKPGVELDPNNVISLAKQYEEFVFGVEPEADPTDIGSLADMESDIPY